MDTSWNSMVGGLVRFRGRGTLGRCAWVIATGVVAAVVVNALSPRGLNLARDYFPRSAARVQGVPPAQQGDGAVPAAKEASVRLQQEGLAGGSQAQVAALFRDARRESGRLVFVDARDEVLYREGHVPGAYSFDPYRPEAQLVSVLEVCQVAEQIVVYCHGADCEDAVLAALFLVDAGIPKDRFLVHVGGFTEWLASGEPVEVGARGGGQKEAVVSP